MFIDLNGKKRYKVNLHMHTNMSDGRRTPEEAASIYQEQGYDALAFTDHWVWGPARKINGVTLLSGVEYNCGGSDCRNGVFHIVGLCCKTEPDANKQMGAQELIDAIHKAGGIAVLAHPAWSLNSPEQIMPLNDVDATEIYNTASGAHHSRRPDSSLIVDMIAARGRYYPLIAADDTHFYNGLDECKSFVMVQAESASHEDLEEAIRAGRYYASQGPEVHLTRQGNEFIARTSPCSSIVFLSNFAWSKRSFTGEGLTEAHYVPRDGESFIRVEVADKDGLRAWSRIIPLE